MRAEKFLCKSRCLLCTERYRVGSGTGIHSIMGLIETMHRVGSISNVRARSIFADPLHNVLMCENLCSIQEACRQHTTAMACMDDLPLDVVKLILNQTIAPPRLKINADTVNHLERWCTLAAVCRRWVP